MPRRTVLVFLAFAAFVSLGLPDGLLGVSWPSIHETLGVPLESLGLLVSVTTAGYLTSSFLSGAILRVLPIGAVLTLSTAAAAVALLGFAITPWWWLMIAFGLLAGLGGGAIDAGLNAYGATHFSPRVLNWLHAFFGLGSTAGPLIVTGVLGAGLLWRWSYVIVGSAQLLLALTFFLTRGRWTEAPERVEEEKPSVASAPVLQTMRLPVVWLGALVFFLYAGVEIVAAQWSYSLLVLGRGVPETTAGLFVGLYWGSLMVGRVIFGLFANRVALMKMLRFCLIASGLGALVFWLDPTGTLSLVGLMVIGFFLAPIFATLISITPANVGAAHAPSAIGFQVAAAGLGGAVLTTLVGFLAGAFGLEVIGLSIVIAAVLVLVCYEALIRVGARARARPGS